MAHSKPGSIADQGNAWRVTTAGGAFMIELFIDPRVKALAAQWHQAREQGKLALDLALSRARSQVYPSQAAADAVVARLDASIKDYDAAELAATERFVREELRLAEQLPGCEWWVAVSLLDGFGTWVHNERHPDDERTFSIPVLNAKRLPTGKAPAREGEDLKRNVRWFYRNLVKQPADTIHDMARDYASLVSRDNDCRSVVQNGITQVRALLNLVTEKAVKLK